MSEFMPEVGEVWVNDLLRTRWKIMSIRNGRLACRSITEDGRRWKGYIMAWELQVIAHREEPKLHE